MTIYSAFDDTHRDLERAAADPAPSLARGRKPMTRRRPDYTGPDTSDAVHGTPASSGPMGARHQAITMQAHDAREVAYCYRQQRVLPLPELETRVKALRGRR